MKLLAFLLCAACFFGLFGLEYFFLLRPSRTLGVTAVAFVVVYVLMTKVYGGFDIGKRKSKPIVFSMALTLLLTDLVTHFLLCIMNTTVIHGGRFVYECPLLLLAVYMLQVALVIIMAYGGNDLYFKVNKPQRCLMVARRGECIEDLIKKVGRYKKQYNIQQVAWLDQPDLLTCVVRERTDLVEYCYQTRKDLYYSLEMSDVVAMAGERVMFDDKTMMYCPVRELRFEERIVKRLGDILVSVVGLVLTSPIDGYVLQLMPNLNPDVLLPAQATPVTVGQLDPVLIQVPVYEGDLGRIKAAMPAWRSPRWATRCSRPPSRRSRGSPPTWTWPSPRTTRWN